jgi:periplasmic copper chaperone A
MRQSSLLPGTAVPALILRARRSIASRRMIEAARTLAPTGASFEAASRRLRTRFEGQVWEFLFFPFTLALPLALAIALVAEPALAQEFTAGDIVIEKPWARATPKGAAVGGGYLTIENKGAAPDRLTGGTAEFAKIEIHQTSSENGVSKMREVKGGLAIPAHGSVTFSPGGYHLMFTHLAHSLIKGESVKATLDFERAGPVEVEFSVMGIGAMGGAMKGMKDMKM